MSSLSFYDVSVPVYVQILGAMKGVLDKGAAHCASKGVDQATLMNARLYDDMFPFNVQVGQALGHSAGAVRRLRGENLPAINRTAPPSSFEALKDAVSEALAYLQGVSAADLAGAAERDVVLEFPGRSLTFTGQGYLLTFAMPNFYFHATTAYDILRHNGVAIGKMDFMGRPQLKA